VPSAQPFDRFASGRSPSALRSLSGLLALSLVLACGTGPEVRYGVEGGEWRSYAGDPGSRKYSPLDQIHAGNFDQLSIAWRWLSADVRRRARSKRGRRMEIHVHEGTPLMVEGRLYGITSGGIVYALDAGTGRQLWAVAPSPFRPRSQRGVTYWREGDDERIFAATRDA